MHQDLAINIFTKMFKKIGRKWKEFIAVIKEKADKEDESSIKYADFLSTTEKFGVKLSSEDKNELLLSFPGMEGADQAARMNIARIYDQKYNIILDKMYHKVDVNNFEGIDDPLDVNGYLGLTHFYRKNVHSYTPITAKEFIAVILANNK